MLHGRFAFCIVSFAHTSACLFVRHLATLLCIWSAASEKRKILGSFARSLAALGTICYKSLRFFSCSLAVLVQQVMSHRIYVEKRIPHCNSTAGEILDMSEFIQTLMDLRVEILQ